MFRTRALWLAAGLRNVNYVLRYPVILWGMLFVLLQCVAVCCSLLQCVAVCCSILQFVAVCRNEVDDQICWNMLQCVAVCSSVLPSVAIGKSRVSRRCREGSTCTHPQNWVGCVLQRCNALQFVAVPGKLSFSAMAGRKHKCTFSKDSLLLNRYVVVN